MHTFCKAKQDQIPNQLRKGSRILLPGHRQAEESGQEINKKAKKKKKNEGSRETLQVNSRVHMNTRENCRHIPIGAVNELRTLTRATRHCVRRGVGDPRISGGGRDGRSLADGDPDVLLIGFESGYGHTIDQNARESEIFKLRDGFG